MRHLLVALSLATCAGLSACADLNGLAYKDPSKVEGALPSEANELRVVQAALVVQAAYATVGQQLDLKVITVAEAKRLRDLIGQADGAVKAARTALPLEDGTTAQKIAVVNALLLRILQEQIIKAGVK